MPTATAPRASASKCPGRCPENSRTHARFCPGFSLDVFYELSRSDFSTVHIALGIHRQTLRRAGSLQLERVGDAINDLAILQASDANASLPSGMGREGKSVRFRVGDIDHVATQIDAARTAELQPFGDEAAVLIEDLDAHVPPIGDE